MGGIYSSAQYIQAGACDILRNSRIKGGITIMIKLAHLAEAHGLNAEPVSEGPCFGFAYLQVDGATSNAEFFESSDEALADHAENALAIGIQNPPRVKEGLAYVPDGPGPGIALDRDRTEDATIEVY